MKWDTVKSKIRVFKHHGQSEIYNSTKVETVLSSVSCYMLSLGETHFCFINIYFFVVVYVYLLVLY